MHNACRRLPRRSSPTTTPHHSHGKLQVVELLSSCLEILSQRFKRTFAGKLRRVRLPGALRKVARAWSPASVARAASGDFEFYF
jgi:hypothetical protein